MAQLDACPTEDQEVVGLTLPDRQHSFLEIYHEIFSMADSKWAADSFRRKNVHNTG